MTRSLYSCLHPAYFSQELWGSFTSLTDSAWEETKFWKSNIAKLNSFAITPVIPSITTCEVIGETLLVKVFMQLIFLIKTIQFFLGN